MWSLAETKENFAQLAGIREKMREMNRWRVREIQTDIKAVIDH